MPDFSNLPFLKQILGVTLAERQCGAVVKNADPGAKLAAWVQIFASSKQHAALSRKLSGEESDSPELC